MTQQQKKLINLNPQFAKQIDSIGFKANGNGVWSMDTKIGGGQIELSESYFGAKEYKAHVWNATFNSWEDKVFDNLNSAKRYIKNRLKGTY